jgi:hypothetical protein
MKNSALRVFLCSLAAGVCAAAPLTEEPLPELRLGSGKTLKLALARSYSANTVLVKHAEGATAVRYDEFPVELQAALAPHRLAADKEVPTEKVALAKVSYDFPSPPAIEPQFGEESVLSGQVFVVTSDAVNVKLGGVKVSIYSREDYRKQAAWYFAHPWEASRMHTRNAELLAKAGDNSGAVRQFEAATESAVIGWMLVTSAQFSTTTDADGRFTLKHCVPPPYFVVAHASRVVEGETENYRWAVLSSLIDEPMNLLLFNENME